MSSSVETRYTISVVIPAHNRTELLRETVASVLAQTCLPKEILIINNGDREINPQWFDTDLIRVINTFKNCGASAARNYGALYAQGDYLAFLDDDDLWERAYLEKVVQKIDQFDLVLPRIDQLIEGNVSPWKKITDATLNFPTLFRLNPGVTGSNIVIKRDVFIELGGFDTRLVTSEDKSLLIEALLSNIRISVLPDCQAVHRQHIVNGRLTDSHHMAAGIQGFLTKYRKRMTTRDVLWNMGKIYLHRSGAGNRKYLPLAILFRLLVKARVFEN